MRLESIGLRSSMMFHRHGAVCSERADHIVVATPDDPDFFFGNLLVFPRGPRAADVARWQNLFAEAFAAQPRIKHVTFTWDHHTLEPPADQEAVAAFSAAGFQYEVAIVLATSTIAPPPHPNTDIAIRPVVSTAEWDAVLNLQVMVSGKDYKPQAYRGFASRRNAQWQQLIERHQGVWLGAFAGETLVGNCGVIWSDDLARIENVETHPAYRRRGICGTLVHHGCMLALAGGNQRKLVVEADEDDAAARIYESLGFKPIERQGTFCKYDRAAWHPQSLCEVSEEQPQ